MRSGLRRRMDESDNRQKTRYERAREEKRSNDSGCGRVPTHREKKEKIREKATRAKFNPRGSVSEKRGHAPRNRLLRSTELAK